MSGALRGALAPTLLLHICKNEVYFTFIYKSNRKVGPTGETSGTIATNVGKTNEMETRRTERRRRYGWRDERSLRCEWSTSKGKRDTRRRRFKGVDLEECGGEIGRRIDRYK